MNHLTGSLLDVAGGRCTDGVWMTMRPSKDCMYVVLDFEGLGSFERTEQEDMLLSVFNAAVSNITIFNKRVLTLLVPQLPQSESSQPGLETLRSTGFDVCRTSIWTRRRKPCLIVSKVG